MGNWLLDTGSLTQALRKKSDGDFSVRVLAEEWREFPRLGGEGLFGPVAKSHRYWSRQVVLLGRGIPWVSAHTLLPEHSLHSELKQVMELADRPLGEFLFSHPQLRRNRVQYSAVAEGCWGRRSLFYLFGKPILVAEFFLPSLID